MGSHIPLLLLLIAFSINFEYSECWQPLIPFNSTFVIPEEKYTLFSSSLELEPHSSGASASVVPIPIPEDESVRGYGFGGYDDDNSYVYSHSVATLRRKPLDLNNILGILSLAGFLGTALFALLQSRNGSRALTSSSGPFGFLGRRDLLDLDFRLPDFFTTMKDFLLSPWSTSKSHEGNGDVENDSESTVKPEPGSPELDIEDWEEDPDYDDFYGDFD